MSLVQTPSSQAQSRLSRELKRLQFTAAGPKMHKITPRGVVKDQTIASTNAPKQTKGVSMYSSF